MKNLNHTICIAPMLGWTDRHYRYLMRLITKKTVLYTEMITTNAILRHKGRGILKFSSEERPLALQLGGNSPDDLVLCAKIARDMGYSEVNINIGCPSDRITKVNFGLSLMYKPELVAECINAIKTAVDIPLSIKCRTGVNERDRFEQLVYFIKLVVDAGVDIVHIHARKGILGKLDPKENRTIPPLRYDLVYEIKKMFPRVPININGGVKTLEDARSHLSYVDGVMIGREAYYNPMLFRDVDELFYNQGHQELTPFDVVNSFLPYIKNESKLGNYKTRNITRHMLRLFNSYPNSKAYRRFMSGKAISLGVNSKIINDALKLLGNPRSIG